jgi:hypothetical protein
LCSNFYGQEFQTGGVREVPNDKKPELDLQENDLTIDELG